MARASRTLHLHSYSSRERLQVGGFGLLDVLADSRSTTSSRPVRPSATSAAPKIDQSLKTPEDNLPLSSLNPLLHSASFLDSLELAKYSFSCTQDIICTLSYCSSLSSDLPLQVTRYRSKITQSNTILARDFVLLTP